MFKKPSKSLRQRKDSEEDAQNQNGTESLVIASFKENRKQKKNGKQSQTVAKAVVSFEEEEGEEEVFQIKKSSQSRKIAKQLDRERKDREAKAQEKLTPQETKNVEIQQEIPIIFKGEFKPKIEKPMEERILTGREAEFAEDNSDDENETDDGLAYRKPDPFRRVLEGGTIPDAATIHAMRKHRQKAREQGGDFIPADETERDDAASKSRLIREDDNDASDDERIDFTINLHAKEKNRRQETFTAAQAERTSDHEDEIEDWEAQQLNKAVNKSQITMVQQESLYQQQYLGNGTRYEVSAQVESTNFVPFTSLGHQQMQAMQTVPESSGPLNPEQIRKKIQERIKSLEEVHRRHHLDYSQTIADRAETVDLIEGLEKEKPELGERYKFAQFLRGYVADLIDCLDTKMPRLETIEKGFTSLIKNRREKIVSRRREDLRDQTDECMSQGKPAVLLPEERIRRVAEREGRRARRRRARQTHLPPEVVMLKQTTHHEGLSSDDEMPESENLKWRSEKERFSCEATALFEDAVDEFASVEGVKRNFELWRDTHMDSYRDAYVSLCLPKVFSPLIRLKLVTWNPLEDTLDIEHQDWYTPLLGFCFSSDETETSLKEDPDYKLASTVVEKVIIPRVTQIVEIGWDPLSTRQTKRLVDLVRLFIDSFPTVHGNSKVFQELVRACVEKLRDALDNDVFVPLYPKNIMDTKMAAAFVQRQFWCGLKLLTNILAWEGILAERLLYTLALDNLLTRYLLLSLRSMATVADRDITSEIDKCRYIMRLLPGSWLNQSNPLPQLDGFVRYLAQLAQQADTTISGGKKVIEDIASMLIRLGADDKSTEIVDKYL